MQLLIIRHAVALDKKDFAKTGRPDDERPLTASGRSAMRRAARGLRRLAKADVLATSPLVRADQTATIVGEAMRLSKIETLEELRPEASFKKFVDWLDDYRDERIVAAVGHSPHLDQLVTWLISGSEDAGVVFDKGGACLISFDAKPGKRRGALEWLLTRSQLRDIAE